MLAGLEMGIKNLPAAEEKRRKKAGVRISGPGLIEIIPTKESG